MQIIFLYIGEGVVGGDAGNHFDKYFIFGAEYTTKYDVLLTLAFI